MIEQVTKILNISNYSYRCLGVNRGNFKKKPTNIKISLSHYYYFHLKKKIKAL